MSSHSIKLEKKSLSKSFVHATGLDNRPASCNVVRTAAPVNEDASSKSNFRLCGLSTDSVKVNSMENQHLNYDNLAESVHSNATYYTATKVSKSSTVVTFSLTQTPKESIQHVIPPVEATVVETSISDHSLNVLDKQEQDLKSLVHLEKSQLSINSLSNTNKKTSITSSSSCLCRICQSNTCRERLISPCNCKGSLAYVHLSCLERWLNQSSRSYCELCLYQFNSILSQRYGLCESLRLWVRHPRNRNNLQSDVLISCLLTIVTGGLVAVCLLGMQYFVLEGHKLGISRTWTRGAISFFLGVVLMGYIITLYLLIKDQYLPWYRWWRQTVNVRLILTPTSADTIISDSG